MVLLPIVVPAVVLVIVMPVSSSIVFWRFYRPPGSDGEKERTEQSVKDLLLVLNPTTNASFATKTFASWQLMNYYFEEFSRPLANEDVEDYLSKKEKAQGSMEQVIKCFSGIQDADFEVSLSPLSIPLAIIYRDTKQEKKFFEEVNKIFYSCYKVLTDNVIYNDKPSYLMLAKILALIGLGKQAEVAFKKWCLVSSDLNTDHGGNLAEKARYASRTAPKQAGIPPKINVECNGPCGKMMVNFHRKNSISLCYYCTNTILCHNCRKLVDEEDNLGVCRKGHNHIEVSEDTPKKIEMHELKKVWEEKWKVFFAVL
ncbi:hypothetical protein VE00_05552 [Pseudogymnoascus sp. WSF 3629]|nr:hypothetical protein VE00_05552 [Pseudogymnoascus sp. WSF 3629]